MRNWLAVALLGVLCGSGPSAKAQETSTPRNETMQPGIPALSKGTWELGVFGGGGVVASLGPDTEFLVVGGRLGRIITADHFPGWLRGNFEIAGELMPAYVVFTPRQNFFGVTPAKNIYGVSVKAIPAQWTFTANRRVVPYLHVAGGILYSTSNVPPGDSSRINFTPQVGGGFHWFVRPRRSLDRLRRRAHFKC
jgi:lipid A 3-O-deacylase